MRGDNKKRSSVGALDLTYEKVSLRIGCIVLIAHDGFYCNAEQIFYAGGEVTGVSASISARRILEKVAKQETHLGKADGAQRLASLVDHGLLTKGDAHWLSYVARLLVQESDLLIDPIYELCRRIVVMHLASKVWQ